VSSELQRVFAALASAVNPGGDGAFSHSSSGVQTHRSGPMTFIAGGRDNSAGAVSSDLRAPVKEMGEALGPGWLELWYQPKIGSRTLDLRGAEALIRMHHPQLGIVQPSRFIPRMERGFCRRCRNSSLPGRSPTGAIF
jgi:hypothetical protein